MGNSWKSEDGIHFRRISEEPFFPCGAPGSWNQCESGHPYVFEDGDRVFLFYQGSEDDGETWYLSKAEIGFDGDRPYVKHADHQ